MKLTKLIALLALLVASAFATAKNDDPVAHLQAVTELMKAMQTEKMMRSITGLSGFPTEARREATFAKLAKMPTSEIYSRLGRMARPHVSMETAVEMTRYYGTSHGKKVLHQTYNSGASLSGPPPAMPSAAERKDFSRPAFIKAKKEFDKAEPMIRHEGFKLMQAIAR